MVGCRRRRIYDLQSILGRPVDFQCRGQEGPPCTVKIGDTVNFNATFNTGKGFAWLNILIIWNMIMDVWELNLLIHFYFTGFPIRGLKQTVVWLNDWVTIPWVGLDMDGCKYLEGSCRKPAGDTLNFNYPVKILSFYPPVSYHCNLISGSVKNWCNNRN